MFDLGWSEMMLVGVVALIVVGPKELPTLFKGVGQAVGKARGMAREFSRAMEAAADESGVKEIDRQIRAATRPVQFATDRLKESALKPAAKPATSAASPLVLKDTAPGPATAALSAERVEDQARIRAEAAQRALEKAQRDAESALKALRDAQRPREEAAVSTDTSAGSPT
ncbi:Twin-arginine translocation protein TatB [Rubellimicrobium mesophilum DSM 19309]|uniref:Sec-independent protein translocase protein TatB n=1 Tax=Rubellimicrobium mesophilum DSM 19309 TaxID=442562 RepID=A0A017HT54_9RHOB|nr:Sec-independent protein translocase protein TatB [Rubellimicrobium mesophilum]EYD77682.1 Twin-arginine translocation protein TatB [Rubellimicrobium mesophilum DSM 19309]